MVSSLDKGIPEEVGREIYDLIVRLFPLCRSITGNGLRDSLKIVQEYIPLEIHEVPSGTKVLDWTIPREWNIRDAFVKDPSGKKVVDFNRSNLHVVNYSTPIHTHLPLEELKSHLHTNPDFPDWVPYRTSYYVENWGFCISQNMLDQLPIGDYEVFIDSTLEDGALSYGEYLLKGGSDQEILISCHSCHPSMCNDNLSGMAVSTILAKYLEVDPKRYSYRFLFIPGTIGSIAWLANNRARVKKIRHGLVVASVGDPGNLTYKKSRRGNADIDRAAAYVLRHSGQEFEISEFTPYGYDERQYCSPGFNLPVGSLTRTPYGRYPQYHTSADNLDFVQPEFLADSFQKYLAILSLLENNKLYRNTHPYGEPQLGKRGLYEVFGGRTNASQYELAMLWVLNFSDGEHTLLDIAERSEIPFAEINEAAEVLVQHGLLEDATGGKSSKEKWI
jgi:aminopeptidase-like protein